MAITPVDIKSGLIKRDIDPTLAIEEVIVTALIYSGITCSSNTNINFIHSIS